MQKILRMNYSSARVELKLEICWSMGGPNNTKSIAVSEATQAQQGKYGVKLLV